MGSKVPKFGAWDGAGGGENFTVYFDNARKTKNNGQKINPNDPEENPDLFGGSAQAQAQAGSSQSRADEPRKTRNGGPSVAQNEPQAPTRTRAQAREGQAKVPQASPTPQEGRAKVPQFGAWNGGEGTQYTAYFDNARKTKNVGSEPMTNRDVGDKGQSPPETKPRVEPKDDALRNAGRGSTSSEGLGNQSSVPKVGDKGRSTPDTKPRAESKDDTLRNAGRGSTSSESLGKQSSVPKTPVHQKTNPHPRTGGGRANQAASIPMYGGWTNNPSQAEGYTVAFARAKEERNTPLNNIVPPSYHQQPHEDNNPKQSCCTIL